MLSPCPFSKDYTIPTNQAWFLLKGFYFYRLILAGLLLWLYFSPFSVVIIKSVYLSLYFFTCSSYLTLSLSAGFLAYKKIFSYATHAQLLVFSDLVCVTLIMHACGGISSGLGALMLVSTTAGGVLIGGRCAMLFAAIASLFLFAEQSYSYQVGSFDSRYYSYAGMLGAGFFTLAFLAYVLAKRTELISSLQQEEIISLEELNQYIIQNMPSGMIIIDEQQLISRYNKTSCQLLGLNVLPNGLAEISLHLSSAFNSWLKKPAKNFVRISNSDAIDLNILFTILPTQYHHFYMITLDDAGLYNKHVQQSKLVSLGRLTANIAHEIRNPLGAISHAGQLLLESETISTGDLRLLQIIENNSSRINAIIEDILQLSHRSDSKQQALNVHTWIQLFLTRFEVENKGCQKQFYLSGLKQDDILILFDEGHLTQILTNLCENALKYGYVIDKKIMLNVSIQMHRACIDVIDYGKGIANEQRDQIFEPFFTSSRSGTGLGLYICRELAHLNQATLSYHLLAEQGCYFRLCVPLYSEKM